MQAVGSVHHSPHNEGTGPLWCPPHVAQPSGHPSERTTSPSQSSHQYLPFSSLSVLQASTSTEPHNSTVTRGSSVLPMLLLFLHPSVLQCVKAVLWAFLQAALIQARRLDVTVYKTCLCYLSTFAWISPTFSAVHFFAFAFLATTFWSKEGVIKGIEGLMSSGSVTECDWHSVQDEEHNLLDCPHKHLVSLRTQHRQLVFPL